MENRLGQVIREKRKMLGLSQDNLGELMGVSTGFIGQLERGETGLRIGNATIAKRRLQRCIQGFS